MNEIYAIIFDMDGVIVDSEPLHWQVEHAIMKQYEIEVPRSEWHSFIGLTDHVIFQYVIDNFTAGRYTVEQLVKAKYDVFLKVLAEQAQTIPGALDFIRWAKQYGRLALTTSSVKEVQEKIFELFNLHPYFDVVITGDQIQHGKPHPEPYLKTLDALHVLARNCLVLEDSLNGVRSAKKAGCCVAAITTSFSEEELWDAGADVVFETFSSLYQQEMFMNIGLNPGRRA